MEPSLPIVPPSQQEVYLTDTEEEVGVRLYPNQPYYDMTIPEPPGFTAQNVEPPKWAKSSVTQLDFVLKLQPAAPGTTWESWDIQAEFWMRMGKKLATNSASNVIQFARQNTSLVGDVEGVVVEAIAKGLHDANAKILQDFISGFAVHPEFTSKVIAPLDGTRPRPNISYYNGLKIKEKEDQIRVRKLNRRRNRAHTDWYVCIVTI